MANNTKNHFSEVMAELMYNTDRINLKKASPLLVSLHQVIEASKGAPNEVVPSAELLRELKANVRFQRYLGSAGKGSNENQS